MERSLRLLISPDSLSSLRKGPRAWEGASPRCEGEEKGQEGRDRCRHLTQRVPEAAVSSRGAGRETLRRRHFLRKRCKTPRLCGRESFNAFAPAVSCSPLVRVLPRGRIHSLALLGNITWLLRKPEPTLYSVSSRSCARCRSDMMQIWFGV